MTIQPGEDTVTVSVPIVDDLDFEDPEEFTVELEIPPESAALHVVSGSQDPVPVKIEDNDGEFEFEFLLLFPALQYPCSPFHYVYLKATNFNRYKILVNLASIATTAKISLCKELSSQVNVHANYNTVTRILCPPSNPPSNVYLQAFSVRIVCALFVHGICALFL